MRSVIDGWNNGTCAICENYETCENGAPEALVRHLMVWSGQKQTHHVEGSRWMLFQKWVLFAPGVFRWLGES